MPEAEKKDNKKPIITRLKRIEGQVRGLQKMVDEERECRDILMQLSAASSALRKVTELIAKNYAQKCIVELSVEDGKESFESLIELLLKFGKK
ncbi:MAG: CsoR family transcriptional regulator, copper-sensing transcriptional repressor [Kosmotogales bacterium]|nr:CsoR family transcriptional regulator, copper-sensing transcriptional repressor [Kosmotogales bacterium]